MKCGFLPMCANGRRTKIISERFNASEAIESLALFPECDNDNTLRSFKNCASFPIMATPQNGHQGDLTSEVLQALSQKDPILSSEAFPSHKSADVKSALDRLGSRSMITYETNDREEAVLESEGQEIAAIGSHEARVFEALRQAVEGLTIPELEEAVGDRSVVKVGQGKAFKSKWISKGKEGRLVASVSWNSVTLSRI